MIFIGSDHRGFELKEQLKDWMAEQNYRFVDLGDNHLDPQDDYVEYAEKVARATVEDDQNRGILLCGSGAGVDMVANKVDGVRSALVFDLARVIQAREHEDANVIALPADVLDPDVAKDMIKAFLETPFSEAERHKRRLEEMKKVEEEEN